MFSSLNMRFFFCLRTFLILLAGKKMHFLFTKHLICSYLGPILLFTKLLLLNYFIIATSTLGCPPVEEYKRLASDRGKSVKSHSQGSIGYNNYHNY